MEKQNMLINMRSTDSDITSLQNLINDVNKDGIILIEVGSYRGQSAEIFINTNKIDKIYCIDPWENGYDDLDLAS